jgi:REP element-mobilizing transposase RayT
MPQRELATMFNLPPPPHFQGLDPNLPVEVYYRNLPHWRQQGATYFVTFRLDDALPTAKQELLRALRAQWEATHPPPCSEDDRKRYAREVTRRAERWLDEGHGECVFRERWAAQLLAHALVHFQAQRYFTFCYVVMPNHCHLIIRPFAGYRLEKILQVCKGYVAHEVNARLKRSGSLWQDESYDQIVRDEEHLWRIVQYIGQNPRKPGLPRERWMRWIHPDWQRAGWDFQED